jgi:hypothetical protein
MMGVEERGHFGNGSRMPGKNTPIKTRMMNAIPE